MDLLLAIGPGAMSGDPLPLLKAVVLAVLALAGLGALSIAVLAAQTVVLVVSGVVSGVLRKARPGGRPRRAGQATTRGKPVNT